MNDDPTAALLQALERLAGEGFRMGAAWEEAHALAQGHEGEKSFDRLHALCHRIEGDAGNAGYWYRRAGIGAFEGPFEAEAETIRAAVRTD